MRNHAFSPPAIALSRFGLGARPDSRVLIDPKRFIAAQFDRFDAAPPILSRLPDVDTLVQSHRNRIRETGDRSAAFAASDKEGPERQIQEKHALRKDFAADVRASYHQAVQARMAIALLTEAPFVERMVHFWSNHFCISADKQFAPAQVGPFERDAIRPHVLGRFEDMLFAVERHPAMLMYLDQDRSIGFRSTVAKRFLRHHGKVRGPNENLAREIMELHTLGVRSCYTQHDVAEFARALTGWSIDGWSESTTGEGAGALEFAFRPAAHEPGSRMIMGKVYAQSGVEQASAALRDFARAPQTETHLGTKIARHFAGDDPPPTLVARLAATFAQTGGDLRAVYLTLIDSPEAWVPHPVKFKTPWEWLISALRGLGLSDPDPLSIEGLMHHLGQPVWKPGSPAGWDDVAASWAYPGGLIRRVEVAQNLAVQVAGTYDAKALAPLLLPASLSNDVRVEISRAESPAVALALLLVSPEFLRR
jgi:uncharacterized protein (DUF1800 family)